MTFAEEGSGIQMARVVAVLVKCVISFRMKYSCPWKVRVET